MTSLGIIGGTGFIGKHFCRKLEGELRYTVRILTRHTQLSSKWPANTKPFIGDLLDIESLKNFIRLNSIVINLSYLSDKSDEDNIQAAKNIAEACSEKRISRLVHCSTAMVVGRTKEPIVDENTICFPLTSYEKTKLEIENILIDRLRGKTEVLIVRPTAVFGPEGKNLIKMAKNLTTKAPLITSLKTSLYFKRRMNLVCVENVVAAIIFLTQIQHCLNGEHFIVSDDDVEENNYYDIINSLTRHIGLKPVKAIYIPFRFLILKLLMIALRRSNTNVHRIYSSNKLFRLGYCKSIQFNEAIKNFANWYFNSFTQIKQQN
jgi:nucleoside-diphosphate-sugar epimerase